MRNSLNKLVGWALPLIPAYDPATLAARLGHVGEARHGTRGGCIARKQGRCPGLEYCADCPWSEGISRDGT